MTAKRWFLRVLGCIAAATAGCQVLPDPRPPSQALDLGPPANRAAAPVIRGCLELDGVDAPAWLETNAIPYRLLYDRPHAFRSYAQHVWVAPPAELIVERLNRLLFSAACRPAEARARLSVRLAEFGQVFEQPEQAHVEVGLHATLVASSNLAPMHQVFSGRRDSTPEVYGAVYALSLLTDELLAKLVAWASEQPR